ncbi:MAG TPA: hypothetical protein VKC59_00440, partial [Candidatus Limnocylindrales bacterium]|nr:hypothetical protein [Candidatus Limnocylindrales bacterium]
MRQIRGQQARWALVGAIALAIMTTSSVMGESARSIDLRANREARPAPTLTADLDRSAVAPYRELARVRAVAALAAPVDVPAAPAKAHPPAIVRNHLWIPSLGISRRVYFY